jgi:hypothetical protein
MSVKVAGKRKKKKQRAVNIDLIEYVDFDR